MNNVIQLKKKLSFNDIFADGKVKQIVWGDTFNDWPIEHQVDYAKKLASAMNEAAAAMQDDRDKCFQAMTVAQQKQLEAEQAAEISKQTMTKAVMDSNEKTRTLETEIMKLLERLKAFE